MSTVPANTAKLQINYSTESGQEIAVNALSGFMQGAPLEAGWDGTQALVDALAGDFQAAWAAHLNSYASNKVKVTNLTVYVLEATTGKAADMAIHDFGSSPLVGASTQDILPPTVGPVVQLWGYDPAGFAPDRKSRRGRIFSVGATTSCADGNTGLVAPACQTELAAGWQAFFAAAKLHTISGYAWTPGILSRRQQFVYPIQAVSVSNHFGHQRRRADALVYTHSAPVTV